MACFVGDFGKFVSGQPVGGNVLRQMICDVTVLVRFGASITTHPQWLIKNPTQGGAPLDQPRLGKWAFSSLPIQA
jgi:hypothetical protein